MAKTRDQILRWMRQNKPRFTNGRTGEVNCTEMVEAWDREEADGAQTLDSDHMAWELAVIVAGAK